VLDKLLRHPNPGATESESRKMRGVLVALYRLRAWATGLIDPNQERIAAECHYSPAEVRRGLALLWLHGWLEVIPRRVFDPTYQAPGWRGLGGNRQCTNAYQFKLPGDAPGWPQFAPLADLPSEDPELEVEHLVVEAPEADGVAGNQPPSLNLEILNAYFLPPTPQPAQPKTALEERYAPRAELPVSNFDIRARYRENWERERAEKVARGWRTVY
jgi:hypothetical protein